MDKTPPNPSPGMRIGILGGSFNPAHDGHRHISEEALRLLRLDQVWWLVSPQNPLKPEAGMAPFADRLASCGKLIDGRTDIVVTDIEADLGTRRTAESLPAIIARYPAARFVWLMGADNLIQITDWMSWEAIFESVPIAVFARPTYGAKALSSKAARDFSTARILARDAGELATMPPPAWAYLEIDEHPASATDIRIRKSGTDEED